MGRKSEQIARAAEPLMQPGEIVEASGMPVIGKFNVGKSVALGIATGIATLGMFSVMTSPKPQPVVVTSRRLIVLGIKVGIVDQPDSKIVTEIPRSEIRAEPARRVLTYYAVDLTDPQGNKVTRMKFPFFNREDARKIAEALGEPAGQATGGRG